MEREGNMDVGKSAGEYDRDLGGAAGMTLGWDWDGCMGAATTGWGFGGGAILLTSWLDETGAGREGTRDGASSPGMRSSRPKKTTRYSPNAIPMKTRNREKISRFLFMPES